MLRSATSGRTDAEVPVVPWQGNVVILCDDDSNTTAIVNDALVLSPVPPPETSPFKCYEESRINNIARVDLVRQVWLAEQEDIDRFQTVHDEEDAVCAICLETVRAKASVVTKCQHVFHVDCCKKSEKSTYLIRNTRCWTCPCCREVISCIIISPLQPMTMPYEQPAPPPLAEHLSMPAQHMGMPAQQPLYSPHLASDLATPTAAPAPRASIPRAATFLSRLGSPAPLSCVGDHVLPVADQALQDSHSGVGRISSDLVYQNEPEALAAAGMADEPRDADAAAAGAALAAHNVAPDDAAEANLALTRWAWQTESASGDGNVVDAGPNGAVVMNIDTPAHPHPLLIPATSFAAEFSRGEGGAAGAAGAAGGMDDALYDIAERVIQKLNSSREYVIGSRNMQTDAATPLRFGMSSGVSVDTETDAASRQDSGGLPGVLPGVLTTLIEWDYELAIRAKEMERVQLMFSIHKARAHFGSKWGMIGAFLCIGLVVCLALAFRAPSPPASALGPARNQTPAPNQATPTRNQTTTQKT